MCCVSASGLFLQLGRVFLRAVFESLKDGTRIFRRLSQRIENAVTHLNGCLECSFLTAVLAVREVFGELIPFAADAESPALE